MLLLKNIFGFSRMLGVEKGEIGRGDERLGVLCLKMDPDLSTYPFLPETRHWSETAGADKEEKLQTEETALELSANKRAQRGEHPLSSTVAQQLGGRTVICVDIGMTGSGKFFDYIHY